MKHRVEDTEREKRELVTVVSRLKEDGAQREGTPFCIFGLNCRHSPLCISLLFSQLGALVDSWGRQLLVRTNVDRARGVTAVAETTPTPHGGGCQRLRLKFGRDSAWTQDGRS